MALIEATLPDADGRRQIHLRSPADGRALGHVDVCNPSDVRGAVERARKAQGAWAATRFRERRTIIERAVRLLAAQSDDYVDVIVSETGKPREEALSVEVLAACDAMQYYAKHAGRILRDRTVPVHLMKTKRLRIAYQPLGVVAIVTPWNFPFLLALNPTVQALMAGNVVLLKPSEVTPFSGELVQRLLDEAGLPEGVFQLVQGDGETGAALIESGVDKVSFTGSVATGRRVAESCARQLIPCTLELGGNDPMIVCADADIDRAAAGAVFGAFSNAGQVCVSTERVYVVDEVADAFTRKVVEETAALRQGPDGETDIGPLIHGPQRDIIDRHVADARAKGARVLAGGRANPAFGEGFYEPTVLADVTQDMEVMREETFGPVMPILRVRDEEEAVRLANDSHYGLNANIWTKDKRKGVELAKQLEAGSAVVNDCMLTYAVAEAPFGGRKDSGLGQVNGEIGLRSYCHAQSILIDRLGAKREFLWFPYSRRKGRWMQRALRWVWGTPLGRWLA